MQLHQLLNLIRPTENRICRIYDPLRIKLWTRLWLGLSHLSELKFRHNFADAMNPLLFFGNWVYTSFFSYANENDQLHVTMYGNKNFDSNINISILTAIIKFIKDSERFDQPLLTFIKTIHSYCFTHTLFNLFIQEFRCVTTRIYIFNLIGYKWTVRYRFYTVLFYTFTFILMSNC